MSERRRAQRGLTLIELMVTIALVMVFLVVGAVSLGTIGVADADTTADTMASAMRYVSTLAVHNNKTYRMVIDMTPDPLRVNGQRWWVEYAGSDDPCARFVPDDADPPKNATDVADLDEAPEDEALDAPVTVDASYTAADDNDLLFGKFEPETTVSAVMTAHHREPQTDGKVAIYFYPNGNAERAWIWVARDLEDDGRRVLEPEVTLALDPLGSVQRFTKILDANDFDKGIRR